MVPLLRALARLPLRALYALAFAIDVLVYRVVRWRVRVARANIDGAFPERTPEERRRILRQSYRNLAQVFVEALWGYGASAAEIEARVAFDDPDLILRYRKRHQSVVLLAAHLGNWEWLLLAAGARFGFPIDVAYKPLSPKSLDAYVRAGRARFGANPIPHKSFLFEMIRNAGSARALALLADQAPLRNAPKHWTTFLHRDTAFFLGPERIARYLDAPVIYASMHRVSLGRYRVRLSVIAEPPYEDGAGAAIAERYARALEATIREHPADWLWVHNKWKYAREPGAARGREDMGRPIGLKGR